VDPAPLLQVLLRTEGLYLDGVVTVVDAKHVGLHLDERRLLSRSREAGQQVAYADTILLNKTDLATPAEMAAALAAIRGVNPTARVVHTAFCDVDTRDILDARSFDVHRTFGLLAEQSAGADGIAAGVGSAASKLPARHTPHLRAVTITLADEAPVSLVALQAWIRSVLGAEWRNIFRVKALLWVHDDQDVTAAPAAAQSTARPAPGSRASAKQRATVRPATSAPGKPVGSTAHSTRNVAPALLERKLFALQGVHAELRGGFVDPASVSATGPHDEGGAHRAGADCASAGCRGGPAGGHVPVSGRGRGRASRQRRGRDDALMAHSPGDAFDAIGHDDDHDHSASCDTGPGKAFRGTSSCASGGGHGLTPAVVIIGRELDEAALRRSFQTDVLGR
jgi:G3E family GTPase